MSQVPISQCFELTLLPGVDCGEFEDFLWKEVFPHFEIMRRTVRNTTHRLLKIDPADSTRRYIWLVFADLVGATPETAGSGPEVLAGDLGWFAEASQRVARFATVASFTEVTGA